MKISSIQSLAPGKKRALSWGLAILWLVHLLTASWFVTHSEVIEGRVIERHHHLLPSRRHGWDCLQIMHADLSGKQVQATIRYNATTAPKSTVIALWRADSGIIRLGAASLAEAFWVEVWAFYLGLLLTVLALIAKAMPRAKKWLKNAGRS